MLYAQDPGSLAIYIHILYLCSLYISLLAIRNWLIKGLISEEMVGALHISFGRLIEPNCTRMLKVSIRPWDSGSDPLRQSFLSWVLQVRDSRNPILLFACTNLPLLHRYVQCRSLCNAELSTGHFSLTRPDPVKRWPDSTRPAIAGQKSDPIWSDPRPDLSPIREVFIWIRIH